MAINSLNASSYGLSGLVSGMNTQEMVEKMLSGTQFKIDSALQKKTTLQNKQSMYRDASLKLKALQSGFLSFTSKTNLLSNAFFNNMTASVKPPSGKSASFSVSASSNSKVGNVMVNSITQLAQAYSRKTQWDASGEVKGVLDKSVAKNLLSSYQGTNATLNIEVGNSKLSIANAPQEFEGMTATQVADYLNLKFADNTNPIAAEARIVNNKLVITSDDKNAYIKVYGNKSASGAGRTLAMSMFGEGFSSLSGQGSFTSDINTALYQPKFDIELDGRKHSIRLGINDLEEFTSPTGSPDDLIASIKSQVERQFGAGVQVTQHTDADGKTSISFESGDPSQTFVITGNSIVMGSLGLKAGISNKLNAGLALKDLNFATELQGSRHSFTINGVGFSYTSDTALSTIINDINKSNAGVTVRYISSEDRFTISKTESGQINTPTEPNKQAESIVFNQTEGNLLSALFQADSANTLTTSHINKPLTGGTAEASLFERGGTFTFNVDGREMKFSVPAKANDGKYEIGEFAAMMNNSFRSTFGALPDGSQVNIFTLNEAGDGFEIISNNHSVIKPSKLDKDTNINLLGFNPQDSTMVNDANTTLTDLGIKFGVGGGLEIKLDGIATPITIDQPELNGLSMESIATLIQDKINLFTSSLGPTESAKYSNAEVKFDTMSGGFNIKGITYEGNSLKTTITVKAGDGGPDGTDTAGTERLFGTNKLVIGESYNRTETDYKITDGQNAVLKINGETIVRANNSFEYDGLSFTLNSTFDESEGATTVSVARDTDKIVEGITDFLKMYNETIDYLNTLYKSEATYKDYPPLTKAQKENMSDREIELWEEKSKEGLLRNDPTIANILDSMRKAMYTRPEDSIALYNMGIDTSYYYGDGQFKEVTAGDIKAYVEKDAEAVSRLFAGEGGIMELLNKSIDSATRSSFASPGSLVQVAGSSAIDTNSTIYKQIKEIDGQLKTLETRYSQQYNRYWKQFNTMEKLIQQMNTQSTWLSQQFAQ